MLQNLSLFLCNNIPSTTTTNSSCMYGEQQQYIPSQDYFIEHYTALLLATVAVIESFVFVLYAQLGSSTDSHTQGCV